MHKLNFRSKSWSLIAILVMGAVVFTGCKKDDDDPDDMTPLVEDGFYITGSASAFSSPSLNGVLQTTRVENLNNQYNNGEIPENERPSLRSIYLPLTADGTFNIVEISGSTTNTWGSSGTIEMIDGTTEGDWPNITAQRGDLANGGTGFSVEEDGLYQVVLDTEAGKFLIVPASTWAIVGSGVGGWASDQDEVTADFNNSSMTWVFDGADDMGLLSAGNEPYKFRISGGWKLPLDNSLSWTASNGAEVEGIFINTNFGCPGPDNSCSEIGMLAPGGGNIAVASSAFNRYTLTWTAGEGFSGSIELLQTVEAVDYSNTSVGLIGMALEDHPDGWSADFMASTPSQNGTAYEWTFNDVNLITGEGFKIREEGTWDGAFNVGWGGVQTLSGTANAELIDAEGNFAVSTAGTYDIKFIVDGDDRTLIFDYD